MTVRNFKTIENGIWNLNYYVNAIKFIESLTTSIFIILNGTNKSDFKFHK